MTVAEMEHTDTVDDVELVQEVIPDTTVNIDQEKYFVWKKNAQILYDHLQTSSLLWPSLTVQFLPDVEQNDTFNRYRLLTGTFTSGQAPEYISVHDIRVKHRFDISPDHYDAEKQEIIDSANIPAKPSIMQKITQSGEVNKVRYMPQNPDLIGTISGNGTVSIFDRTKHPSQPSSSFKSEISLDFHKQDGFGLSWNFNKEGNLLTAASDGLICLYDITKWDANEQLNPRVFAAHDNGVNDVKYTYQNDSIFASVGEDRMVKIWDQRSDVSGGQILASTLPAPVNSVATNPLNQFVLAAGDSTGAISIYDLRSFDKPVFADAAKHHGSAITCLEWNNQSPSILASGSEDSLVKIWDMSKRGQDSSKDGLIFVHGGHLFGVNDLSWNPNEDKMLASVSDDNTLQVWKPAI